MVEASDIYAFIGCYSMDRHVTATEYEEIIRWCQANGYYNAVKAEDTNPISEMGWKENLDEDTLGKVHLHFLVIREQAKYSRDDKDHRYGCTKVSHLKAKCLRECPSLAMALAESKNARKYALLFTKMTTDHYVAYMSKESQLKTFNLPDDMAVIRPYLSLKEERKFNPEDDAHVKAYKKTCVMPATYESVWNYFTSRWYEANDSKRLKRTQLQEEATINLLHAVNGTKPAMSKKLKALNAELEATCTETAAPKCSCTYDLQKEYIFAHPYKMLYSRNVCNECKNAE